MPWSSDCHTQPCLPASWDEPHSSKRDWEHVGETTESITWGKCISKYYHSLT